MNSALTVNTYLLFLFCQYFSTRQWKATVTTGILFSSLTRGSSWEISERSSLIRVDVEGTDGPGRKGTGGSGRRSQGTTVAMESREGGAEEEAGSPAAREMLSCGKQTFHQQGGPRWAVGLAELSRLSQSLRDFHGPSELPFANSRTQSLRINLTKCCQPQ